MATHVENTSPSGRHLRLWSPESSLECPSHLSSSTETIKPSTTLHIRRRDSPSVTRARSYSTSSESASLGSVPVLGSPLRCVVSSDIDHPSDGREIRSSETSSSEAPSPKDTFAPHMKNHSDNGEQVSPQRSKLLLRWVQGQRIRVEHLPRRATRTDLTQQVCDTPTNNFMFRQRPSSKRETSLRTTLIKAKIQPGLAMSSNQLTFDSCEAHTKSNDVQLTNRASDKAIAYQVFLPVPMHIPEHDRALFRGALGVMNSQGVVGPGQRVQIRGLIRDKNLDVFEKSNCRFLFKLGTLVPPNGADLENLLIPARANEKGYIKEMFRSSPLVRWQDINVIVPRSKKMMLPGAMAPSPADTLFSGVKDKHESAVVVVIQQATSLPSSALPELWIAPRTKTDDSVYLQELLLFTSLVLLGFLNPGFFEPERSNLMVHLVLRLHSNPGRALCCTLICWCFCLARMFCS